MKLLLDTHAVLWMLNTPDRLSREAAAAILSPQHDLLVSAVSAYEVAQRRFREPAMLAVAAQLVEVVERAGMTWTPLTPDQAADAGRLDWTHRDPFDRMLAAQAIDLAATLVTADAALRDFDRLPTLW